MWFPTKQVWFFSSTSSNRDIPRCSFAALYFNKIQCFCFEEQRLEPHEEVDMPVFFFIDPEILQDPAMENVNSITLSYTFFKTGEEEVTPAKASASPGTTAAVAPSPSTTSTN